MKQKPVIASVPREMISFVWHLAVPHLLKGMATATDTSLEQVVSDLFSNRARLWLITEKPTVLGAFVTATYHDPAGRRFLGVYGLGGEDIKSWGTELGEAMTQFARSQDVESVKFCGRKAWSRVLPTFQITGSRNGEAIYERAVA